MPDRDRVILAGTLRSALTPTQRRQLKRRNAIEPVIGHCKSDGWLERTPLKGAEGDAATLVLTTAGHTIRLRLAWLRLPWWLLIGVQPDGSEAMRDEFACA